MKIEVGPVYCKALVDAGVDPSCFGGHSFTIGVEMTAARIGQ